MSDLVKRLRSKQVVTGHKRTWPYSEDVREMVLVPEYGPDPDAQEAADRIEELEAALSSERLAGDELLTKYSELEAGKREYAAKYMAAAGQAGDALERADALEAEVERLRGLISHIIEAWDWRQIDTHERDADVIVDAIDAARAALQEETSNK